MALRYFRTGSGDARRLRAALCRLRALSQPPETTPHHRYFADSAGFGIGGGVSAGFCRDPAFWAAARLLAGGGRAGWIRAVSADLVDRGRGYSRAHGGGGCGEARSTPRARPAAGGDPRAAAGRNTREAHRVVMG